MNSQKIQRRNFWRILVFCYMLAIFGWVVGGLGLNLSPADAAPGSPPSGEAKKNDQGGARPKLKSRQLPGIGKYQVVRVDAEGVYPRILNMEQGSTVIWFNATDRYVSVVFNKGDLLNRVTRSSTLFFLAPDGTYVSAAFGSGATASTAFARPGTFHYFVTGLPVSDGGAFAQVVVK